MGDMDETERISPGIGLSTRRAVAALDAAAERLGVSRAAVFEALALHYAHCVRVKDLAADVAYRGKRGRGRRKGGGA